MRLLVMPLTDRFDPLPDLLDVFGLLQGLGMRFPSVGELTAYQMHHVQRKKGPAIPLPAVRERLRPRERIGLRRGPVARYERRFDPLFVLVHV